ncbi:MAG: hypothetical protein HOI29_07920 [Planctomycetes bacterium]|nr:hypothetical protein [Planctomycetota bacterium]MBT6453478.1 hypothetical protein [Planctomycetota bacterium]MBT6541189.1 hypothetical protein [Planctomycetota bacterium]MBT6969107.1 hypothetical protein [Planctomycetota bacterium]MBT7104178.1 hypothetical protein [Planctomycetota bacterium]
MSEKRNDVGPRSMILLLLLGALLPTPLKGDTVLLVNGSRIDGLVLDQDQTRLVLQIGGLGTIQIPNSTVRSIEKNRRLGPTASDSSSSDRQQPSPPVTPVVPLQKKTRSPLLLPRADSRVKLPPELPEMSGRKIQQVKEWVGELQRQRARNRSRAEQHLSTVGPAVIPFVIPVARSTFDLARISALRILLKTPHFMSVDVALEGLSADNRWVRKLSWQLIVNISGISGEYSWDTQKLSAKRAQQSRRWHQWVQQQRRLYEKQRMWNQDQYKLRGESAHSGR